TSSYFSMQFFPSQKLQQGVFIPCDLVRERMQTYEVACCLDAEQHSRQGKSRGQYPSQEDTVSERSPSSGGSSVAGGRDDADCCLVRASFARGQTLGAVLRCDRVRLNASLPLLCE
ncbi:unnamed protein product, partial [Mycena citricolor]